MALSVEEAYSFHFPWVSDLSEGESRFEAVASNRAESDIVASAPGSEGTWMIFSRGLDEHAVTMRLLRDSWCLLKHIRLEHWVEVVFGRPSASILVFESYLEKLSFSLFEFLHQGPEEKPKYHAITMVRPRSAPRESRMLI